MIGAEARIIQIDPAAAEIGRNRGVTVGIVGDIEAVVEQMTQEARKNLEVAALAQAAPG